MAEVIGTCGHNLEDIKGNELIIRNNYQGEKCLTYVSVCDKCSNSYLKDGLVLQTEKEQNDWLYGENTVENIQAKMQERGYTLRSRTATHSSYFFDKLVDDITIHAAVNIKEGNMSIIELSYTQLKYFMVIATGLFMFDHPKFNKIESIIVHYARICAAGSTF